MSNRQQELKTAFQQLLNDSGSPGQGVRSRIDEGSPIRLYASCGFPSKSILLEIGPIKNAWLPEGFRKPRIKGLSIDIESKEVRAGGGGIVLLLELQQQEALDVFITFVARIFEELDGLEAPAAAVKAVIATVERWKEFFSGNSKILSEGRQPGLYCELYILSQLEKYQLPIGRVVGVWTGSEQTDQDFEFGYLSVEVKTSATVDATSVNITDVRQLDNTGLDMLYLARVLLDVRRGQDNTLPRLIASLREKIASRAPEQYLEFDEKLIQAGYQNKHAEHYANRSYAERKVEYYNVEGGFPRLVETDLPVGMTRVSYEISLESCQDFKHDANQVQEQLRNYCD